MHFVYIDTSIYEAKGFDFDYPDFRRLRAHGRAGRIALLYTYVTLGEVRHRISLMLSACKPFFSNRRFKEIVPLRRFHDFAPIFDIQRWIRNHDIAELYAPEIIDQFMSFLKGANAIEVDIELSSSREVLKKYFNTELPFESTKDKKTEFPDAHSVDALSKWCRNRGYRIHVVSNDNGLREACTKYDCFTVYNAMDDFLDSLESGTLDIRPPMSIRQRELAEGLARGAMNAASTLAKERRERERLREEGQEWISAQVTTILAKATEQKRIDELAESAFKSAVDINVNEPLSPSLESDGVNAGGDEDRAPRVELSFSELLEECRRLNLSPILSSNYTRVDKLARVTEDIRLAVRRHNGKFRVLAYILKSGQLVHAGFNPAKSMEFSFYYWWLWIFLKKPTCSVTIRAVKHISNWDPYRYEIRRQYINGPKSPTDVEVLDDLRNLYQQFGYEAERAFHAEKLLLVEPGRAA